MGWMSQKIRSILANIPFRHQAKVRKKRRRKTEHEARTAWAFRGATMLVSCCVQKRPFDPFISGSARVVSRGLYQKCNKVSANVPTRMPAGILRSLLLAERRTPFFLCCFSPVSSFWRLRVRQDSWIFIRRSAVCEVLVEKFCRISCRGSKKLCWVKGKRSLRESREFGSGLTHASLLFAPTDRCFRFRRQKIANSFTCSVQIKTDKTGHGK